MPRLGQNSLAARAAMVRRDLQQTRLSTGYQRSLQAGWALTLWWGNGQDFSVASLGLEESDANAFLAGRPQEAYERNMSFNLAQGGDRGRPAAATSVE